MPLDETTDADYELNERVDESDDFTGVRHVDEMPETTPADEVVHVDGKTVIMHGPGKETHVHHDGAGA